MRVSPSSSGAYALNRLRLSSLALPILLLLTLVFFYRLAFTDLILARGDTYTYFYPYWHARNAALLDRSLPLWSPDLFMGVPLLANSQLGTFYPPNWLVAPLAPPDGIRVSILLHVAWAGFGTYLLARRTLGVTPTAALLAASLFAFGGHVSAHVEQINQLQGLAWLPWLLLLFHRALATPVRNIFLLAMALALQFFSGHTQTVFISGVALGLYALATRPLRGLLMLAVAGGLALLLAAPQLIPTLELTRLSNRSGGLALNQAVAFSFSPFVTGRGLLPSYDTTIFAEYIAYPGVIGLGLALLGLFSGSLRPRLRRVRLPLSPRPFWAVLALVGLGLAYGMYNPMYWLLGSLPGFNLFRVPARWLALFSLSTALLAALGVDHLRKAPAGILTARLRSLKPYAIILLVVLALAAASLLTLRQNDLTPISLPTPLTWLGWGLALALLLLGIWRRVPLLLVAGALAELWLASQILPYNQLVPPDAYRAQRQTISQLRAYTDQSASAPWWETAPGRTLSISSLLFDPGDRAALEARYSALGMSPEAFPLAFDTVKLREVLGANLPLVWGIPSTDGFDGGVLPTKYYSAFSSLMLPAGTPRTSDGRLRELLALPECGGACIPDQRWLDLTNTRYLITDKNYDLTYDGVFYDTQFPAGSGAAYPNPQQFTADAVDVLCDPCGGLSIVYGETVTAGESVPVGGYERLRFRLSQPITAPDVSLLADDTAHIRAVTLVDTRTGAFQQLTPAPWERVLSSDVKLYQNEAVLPRAFVVGAARFVPDDDAGTEQALALMNAPDFDPAQTVVISGLGENTFEIHTNSSAEITTYMDTYIALEVNADAPGYLVLTDAYYPGWSATLNREPVPLERANVMFRAVQVPAGRSAVAFIYQPAWLSPALLVGGVAWLGVLLAVVVLPNSRRKSGV